MHGTHTHSHTPSLTPHTTHHTPHTTHQTPHTTHHTPQPDTTHHTCLTYRRPAESKPRLTKLLTYRRPAESQDPVCPAQPNYSHIGGQPKMGIHFVPPTKIAKTTSFSMISVILTPKKRFRIGKRNVSGVFDYKNRKNATKTNGFLTSWPSKTQTRNKNQCFFSIMTIKKRKNATKTNGFLTLWPSTTQKGWGSLEVKIIILFMLLLFPTLCSGVVRF